MDVFDIFKIYELKSLGKEVTGLTASFYRRNASASNTGGHKLEPCHTNTY